MVCGRQCAVCCCTLSVFGIMVLLAMGSMLSGGDPYVGGHHLVATAKDRAERASACYSAAGIYCLCLVLSGVCWVRGGREAANKAASD
mmetsp:Transcript_42379/g.103851  ORF Transcript_42379/g.103851 Transcript_42379/m.103851 type:complete len:88 (-) Transcript_42379:256-519(-)